MRIKIHPEAIDQLDQVAVARLEGGYLDVVECLVALAKIAEIADNPFAVINNTYEVVAIRATPSKLYCIAVVDPLEGDLLRIVSIVDDFVLVNGRQNCAQKAASACRLYNPIIEIVGA